MNKLFSKLVNESTVGFVDTCFVLNDSFIRYFYPKLDKFNRNTPGEKLTLNILPSCILELKKLTFSNKENLAKNAQCTLDIISRDMDNNHNFKMYKEGTCTQFGDAALLSAVIMTRLNNPVNVFTQDSKLTHDLYKFNELKSCLGHEIEINSFDEKNGSLISPGINKRLHKGCKKAAIIAAQISA